MDSIEANITYFLDEMEQEERAEYADDFLLRGEFALLHGDFSKGIELFDLAAKCDPNNGFLYFRQGISLFDHGSEKREDKALQLAHKKFRLAAALDPDNIDNWQAWGNTLSLLADKRGEPRYLYEAEEKYRKALETAERKKAAPTSELYWDYGILLTEIAEESGEALDANRAIAMFEKATSLQELLSASFWNDYGAAALLLANRITDIRLYVKAINCFKHAISIDSTFHDGWASLSFALESLYELTHDEDHFSQANDCYAKALQLQPDDFSLWMNWAQLLSSAGRRAYDRKRLRSCIEKCHRAHACDPSDPLPLALWAEVLALLGELSERLDLLYDAQNKIAQAEEIAGEDPDVCYSYGMCLNSFGQYFQDLDYYYQAVEKFQQGLSIDRSRHDLWYAIAETHITLNSLEEGIETLERACHFYRKAIDLNPSSYYIIAYAIALSKLGETIDAQDILDNALFQFERALQMQRNAVYLHPDWLFHYAHVLDMLGDFQQEEIYYTKAIEVLSHVLMIDPDFPHIQHKLALTFAHKADLTLESEFFYRAFHHFRLALQHDEENDQILLDWAVTLINLSQNTQDTLESEDALRDAENKLIHSAKLGHAGAYYHLSALYSILNEQEKSLTFLYKARQFGGLPGLDELLEDDWLESLRCTSGFREFMADLERRQIREP